MDPTTQSLFYLFIAYMIIWAIISAYLFLMGKKISKLEKDVKNLNENLNKQ